MDNLISKFSKHYMFTEVEPRIQQLWADLGIYNYDPDSDKETFSVDTPPPYVSSAHLHVGHAMSYSQAEFIVRYKRMMGYNIFYPMGFDDNGLPTEKFVEKKYKLNKNNTNRKDFIDLCLKETQLGIQTYKDLWRSLGISVDWSLSYSTIDERSRTTSQKSFLDLVEKGFLSQKNDPVMWCYSCGTSLAQAEIDTIETEAFLYDIMFHSDESQELIISTTRPELLPACVALYVNPDDQRFSKLVGKEACVPLFSQKVLIRTHPEVDMEFGTGIMMVCTWGDSEDVAKWREHKLDTIEIFDHHGKLNEKAGEFAGLKPVPARKAIVEKLQKDGLIKGKKPITHAVGVHDRCETPVEFKLAKQWFIDLLAHRQKFSELGEKLQWHPHYMKTRYTEWVNGLKWDWCISRQRFYGVPFPVWYCTDCATPLFATLDRLPVDPTVDRPAENETCAKCGCKNFTGEQDVMDTWMTSSCSPLINSMWANPAENCMERVYPMSIRVQAFEIIRTWLFYTIVKGYYHTGELPWKQVMISGWGLDQHGKKMSKSKGNFVEPGGIITKYSADALRFWAGSATLGQNLRWSETDVATGKKLLTKLWNAAKLIAGYMPDSPKDLLTIKPQFSSAADQWIQVAFMQTVKKATESFESFQYSHALQYAVQFFFQSFCDNYLEIVKARLWEDHRNDKLVFDATVKNLVDIFFGTLKLFAPFVPYITEELYQILFEPLGHSKSIHTEPWPEYHAIADEKTHLETGELLIEIIAEIRKLKTLEGVHSNFPLENVCIEVSSDMKQLMSLEFDLKNAVHARTINFIPVNNLPSEDTLSLLRGTIKLRIGITLSQQSRRTL